MDLNFKVENQKLNRTDNNTLVNLSENYLRLWFTFSDDWESFTKFALFKHDDKTTRIGLVEDRICIPSSLLQTDKIVFSLYGLKTENDIIHRITTNIVRLQLLDSGYTQDVDDPIDDEEVDIVEEIYIAIAAKSDTTYVDEQLALKTNIGDIKNNLTSTDTDKPLSAKQGKELKTLVDTKANSSDMTTALAGKSEVGHKHLESDITDLKDYSEVGHKHLESDITDLGDYSVVGHTHLKSDVTDFAHTHDDRYYTETETDTLLSAKVNTTDIKDNLTSTDSDKPLSANQGKSLKTLVDTKANSSHTHTKSEVTDFSHTHTKSEITDFSHNHDERYYTESEVDEIIANVKHDLNNKLLVGSDKDIIQTDEKADITAYLVEDGMPKNGKTIYFYVEEEE